MDIINTLKDTLGKTAKQAVKKSNDLVEITKLKLALNDIESEIEKAYKEIGQIVYQAYKDDTEIDVDIKAKCENIGSLFADFESIKSKVNEIKDISVCSGCSAEIPGEAIFCQKCGAKVADQPDDQLSDDE